MKLVPLTVLVPEGRADEFRAMIERKVDLFVERQTGRENVEALAERMAAVEAARAGKSVAVELPTAKSGAIR